MPHQIRITDIRIERLQDISDEDCLREGVWKEYWAEGDSAYLIYNGYREIQFDTPREAFSVLINRVSGKGTWQSNPYVFVYEFELVK